MAKLFTLQDLTVYASGNSFGRAITAGTNDAFSFGLETNNTERIRINSSGQTFVSNYDLTLSGSFLAGDLFAVSYRDTTGGTNLPALAVSSSRLDLSSTTASTGTANRLASNTAVVYRQLTSSVTDSIGGISAYLGYLRFNIATSQTWTYTGSRGIAAFRVQDPANDGAGTLAITDFFGLYITASSLNTGTRKTGIFLGAYTGATNNIAIADNAATGSWFINSTTTNPSQLNGSLVLGTAAISTSATDGFLYLPSCAGAPSGTPTTRTGTCATVYDTTNNKIWVYNGSWRGVVVA